MYILFISSHQGYNARRLLEPDDGELDNNQSDCVSNSRKEAPSGTANDKVLLSVISKTLSETNCSLAQVDVIVILHLCL